MAKKHALRVLTAGADMAVVLDGHHVLKYESSMPENAVWDIVSSLAQALGLPEPEEEEIDAEKLCGTEEWTWQDVLERLGVKGKVIERVDILSRSKEEKHKIYAQVDAFYHQGQEVKVKEHESGFPAVTLDCGDLHYLTDCLSLEEWSQQHQGKEHSEWKPSGKLETE